jgi:hypothetical protein
VSANKVAEEVMAVERAFEVSAIEAMSIASTEDTREATMDDAGPTKAVAPFMRRKRDTSDAKDFIVEFGNLSDHSKGGCTSTGCHQAEPGSGVMVKSSHVSGASLKPSQSHVHQHEIRS